MQWSAAAPAPLTRPLSINTWLGVPECSGALAPDSCIFIVQPLLGCSRVPFCCVVYIDDAMIIVCFAGLSFGELSGACPKAAAACYIL